MNKFKEGTILTSELERVAAVLGGTVEGATYKLKGSESTIHLQTDANRGPWIVVSFPLGEEIRIALRGDYFLKSIDDKNKTAYFSSKGGREFFFNSDGSFGVLSSKIEK